MKKAIKYIIISMLAIIAGIAALMFVFTSFSLNYQKEQSSYFDKVSYTLDGKIISMDNLGGNYYLIKVIPDSFEIENNILTKKEDCVGVYIPGDEYVYVICTYDFNDDNRRPNNIKINSENRIVIYDGIQKRKLRTSGLYRNRLPFQNNNVAIHF